MSDQDDQTDRRNEGVRIIGAQEAAEAAGRPDVVRRRRRSEKKFGDRPDEPAAVEDLPKITISTTESEPGADRFGGVPVVRPGGESGERPRWIEDNDLPPAYGEDSERAGFGHARIVPGDDTPASDASSSGDDQPDATPESGSGSSWDEPTDTTPDDSTQTYSTPDYSSPTYSSPDYSSPDYSTPDYSSPTYSSSDYSTPDYSDPRYTDPEPEIDPLPAVDPAEPFATAAPGADSGTGSYDDDFDGPEDDSFVLPHWTEPPTGQVPKVVVGEDAPEPEPLATYGSQPRWRDEGERSTATDFDDLIDDEPLLGALRNDDPDDPDDRGDFFSDGPYDDDRFTDDEPSRQVEVVYDEDDEFDEFAPEEDVAPPGGGRPRRRPDADGGPPPSGGGGGDRNIVTAIAVGVGLVAIGLICFTFGSLPTALLATVVVTFAGFEYFNAVRESGHNPATLLGIVAIAGVMVASFTSGLAAYPIVLGLTIMTGLLWFLWVAPGERSATNLGLTLLGVMWVGLLGSFATLFVGLGKVLEDGNAALDSNPGIGVLIAAVIAAVSHDVGAYFIGRQFGRTPLSAASPNKTQEGLAGGVVTSLVVTVVVVGVVGIAPIGGDLARVFIFALLCALVAPLGDLCESFIKRDLGIKDMGTILPGHGGVLDRFDALLFVLPTAYFVTLLFDIWGTVGS